MSGVVVDGDVVAVVVDVDVAVGVVDDGEVPATDNTARLRLDLPITGR